MLVSSPVAAASCAAPAALDRASSASARATAAALVPTQPSTDPGPDVVVTLGGGAPPAASTYDATGRLPGGASLEDLGANGPASLAHASEVLATGGDAGTDGGPPDAPAADDAVGA